MDDGIACTRDSCDEAGKTVLHDPVDALCSDGVLCNGAETCQASMGCLPGTSPCGPAGT